MKITFPKMTLKNLMIFVLVIGLLFGIELGRRRRNFFLTKIEIHAIKETGSLKIAAIWNQYQKEFIGKSIEIKGKLSIAHDDFTKKKLEASLERWLLLARKAEEAERLYLQNANQHKSMREKYETCSKYIFLSCSEDQIDPIEILDLEDVIVPEYQ